MGFTEGKRIWLVFVMVGVFFVGLLAFTDTAFAHGTHTSASEAPLDLAARDEAKDLEGHCHGGAFCSGPAIILVTPPTPLKSPYQTRYALPAATRASPVSPTFDPPPPRNLI